MQLSGTYILLRRRVLGRRLRRGRSCPPGIDEAAHHAGEDGAGNDNGDDCEDYFEEGAHLRCCGG